MWVAVANRYPDESSLPVPAAVQETKEADAGRAVQAPPQLAPEAGQGSPTPAAGASAGAIREPSADAKGARDKDAAAAEPELKRSMVAGNLKADPASTRQSEVRKERSDAPARVDELAAAKPKNEVTLDKYAAATPPPVPPPPTPAPAAQSPSSSPVAGARGGNAAAPKAAETALTDRATFRAAPSSAAESVVATVNIASPDSRSRWRITGSTVQRSTDNGGTWTDQDPGVRVRLLAGSAPHPDICWIVGAQGTVLVSVDGKSWQHVKSPDSGSLVSVLATSADAATVTTSDGRTFVTTDRGQTWGTKF
jgi:hypothetical protein